MIKDSSKKIKLLKLNEILQQESSQKKPLTTEILIQMLADANINTDRLTLRKDIVALRDYGIPVKEMRIGHQKGYYLEDSSFSVAEIKILLDAVQAASFISPELTNNFTDKLANLAGSRRKDIIDHNIICFNTRKHSNEIVYQTVDLLEKAICTKKKVSFLYFDLNENKERVYRKDRKRYIVEPVALVFHEDNYYLMTFSEKYDSIVNYRIDRIDDIELLEEGVCDKAIIKRDDLSEYTKHVFKMYGGPDENITLEFDDSLLNVMYDKFGEDLMVVRIGAKKCVAAVRVQISPTFMGWVFQFGSKMKILSPERLENEYKSIAKEILEN